MAGLLDHRGRPIEHRAGKPERTATPKVGDAFGQWAGRDAAYLELPGGAVMQFDLNRLTLSDYRTMRHNYQLGASLTVLSFAAHQIDWTIECESAEIADMIESDLRENWTPLVRALAQAFWAGYSPIAVNYKNAQDGYVRISKFKDLIPEESRVHWKQIEGWAPPDKPKPKIYKFDGMMHNGFQIPVENSLWFPMFMENGDYYGRKLLKPAFPSWFFSTLIHLFANRYFERYGEPLPIGRARFDDEVDLGNGEYVNGKKAMETLVNSIRSRAAVVLPSDRDPNTKEYDYDIEYLESQMRGADFERYLSRLDEEMSLALFTPVLLFRTADVGSYNLGQAHLQIFQQALNTIAGEFQYYLQNYLVDRLRVINFGENSPRAKWVFRRAGNADAETFKQVVTELIRQGRAGPDLRELSQLLGLTLHEYEQITEPAPEPVVDPNADPEDPNEPPADPATTKASRKSAAQAILAEAVDRASREYGKGKGVAALGYRNRLRDQLHFGVVDDPDEVVGALYASINGWMRDVADVGLDAERFHQGLRAVADAEWTKAIA